MRLRLSTVHSSSDGLAPSVRPLVDLIVDEYNNNVVTFASSSAKFQYVVNFVSLAAAYGMGLRSDKSPSGRPLTDLEYADDVVIFEESSTELQHVVNLVSKLAAAYGLRLRPDKCKQMWVSLRPRTGISVDGQLIDLVDEFCKMGCTLKNNGR
ncbi:hypothetical protein RB195_022581 [Necator americanus]|uniref:Reverse transcriptase domain-containing protein n=1 Tax=Necator americanus TaxID=51031 RepID=A0ABR1EG32_NECAM